MSTLFKLQLAGPERSLESRAAVRLLRSFAAMFVVVGGSACDTVNRAELVVSPPTLRGESLKTSSEVLVIIHEQLESQGYERREVEPGSELWVRPFDEPLRNIAATISPKEHGYWVIVTDGLNGPRGNFRRVKRELVSGLQDELGHRAVTAH